MSGNWHEVIRRQFAASIASLRQGIENCPDSLWDDRSEGTPVWHLAYHALFYCDLYLSDNLASFVAPDFHVDKFHFLPGDYGNFGGVVGTPETCYTKQQLLDYADHCKRKCHATFQALTEDRCLERCGFWWYHLNVDEFLINALRHTQHHAGQIALVLRRRAGVGISWLGTDPNN